jgi:hypothetical protein
MRPADVHPYCTTECTHRDVPELGGFIVTRPMIVGGRAVDRMEAEHFLWDTFFGDTGNPLHVDQSLIRRIDYLGALGPSDERMHTWRVGGKKWRGVRGERDRTEGKTVKRELKYEHRPGVWTGSGLPVGPVDFSRPAPKVIEAYPAPTLTSKDMPAEEASRPASDLLMLAHERGWIGEITQARGHVPHASYGTPGKAAKFSEAVRLRRGDCRAVAVRMDGSWASMWTWSPTQFFARHKLLDEFREALA